MYLGASAIRDACIQDPATLEALACRKALALAKVLSLTKVIIASDCKQVIEDINSGIGGRIYANIIREIAMTAAEFLACSFVFEGQDSNIESHSLAKFALVCSVGGHLWLLQPPDIHCITMNVVFDQ